jgi:hypothetical protein
MTLKVIPIVLFRDGQALTQVKALSFPGGIEAHKHARPTAWTQWQRNGDQIEMLNSKRE